MQGFDGGCLFFGSFFLGGGGFFGSFLGFFIRYLQLTLNLGFGFKKLVILVETAGGKQAVQNSRNTGEVIAENFCQIRVFAQPAAHTTADLKSRKK